MSKQYILMLLTISLVFVYADEKDKLFAKYQAELIKYQTILSLNDENQKDNDPYRFLDRTISKDIIVGDIDIEEEGYVLVASFGGNFSAERIKETFKKYSEKINKNIDTEYIDRAIINALIRDQKLHQNFSEFAKFIQRKKGTEGYLGGEARNESENSDLFEDVFTFQSKIAESLKAFTPRQIKNGQADNTLINLLSELSKLKNIYYNGFNIELTNTNFMNLEDIKNLAAVKPNDKDTFVKELLNIYGTNDSSGEMSENVDENKIMFDNFTTEYQGGGVFRDKKPLKKRIFIIDKNLSVVETASFGGNGDGMTFEIVRQNDGVTSIQKKHIERTSNDRGNEFSILSEIKAHGGIAGETILIGQVQYLINFAINWSPIILDWDQNGIPGVSDGNWLPHEEFSQTYAVLFDIDCDGQKELIEWVSPNDALLVSPDENGNVVNGNQLFGNMPSYTDGYEKLQKIYDYDNNNIIEQAELNKLYIWRDANTNGSVETGEMTSARSANIEKIFLHHQNYQSFCIVDGKVMKIWDWWPRCLDIEDKNN